MSESETEQPEVVEPGIEQFGVAPHATAPATSPATLCSIGEAAVLRRIFPRLPDAAAALIGPGDDAAVLAAPDGRFVVTTDTMVHGPDFRLAWSRPADLGWKAAATNLADIAAMGARPTGLVVALAAPAGTPVKFLEDLADGLRMACEALAPGCGVVGGDLAVSATLVIAVTAFGDLEGRDPVLRSGARPGDRVAVSGPLGLAAEGLALLFERAVDDRGVPDSARVAELRVAHPEALAAQLTPRPPLADGPAAARAGATAMLDLSDGLAIDARRVADASGVCVDLSRAAIGSELALTGGEDHALLATFPPDVELPSGFRDIGRVISGSGLSLDGTPYTGRGGWDPYADWDGRGD
ncbi:MAG TPA: thiamine-phosphate kinase [Pseudolysinimonas sp.]|nr:thiamine-phosphate kinase [Pseudolysinimonas sp.]